MKITDKIIRKSIVLNIDVDSVWSKWTTHEGLLTFFGNDNKIELIPGGAFEIYFLMDNPYGLRGSEGCKVLSYLPKRMLSFSWNAPPQYVDSRDSDYKTWVVIELLQLSDDDTKVVLTHLGWPQGDEWNNVYEYFDSAWERVLGELKNSINLD